MPCNGMTPPTSPRTTRYGRIQLPHLTYPSSSRTTTRPTNKGTQAMKHDISATTVHSNRQRPPPAPLSNPITTSMAHQVTQNIQRGLDAGLVNNLATILERLGCGNR